MDRGVTRSLLNLTVRFSTFKRKFSKTKYIRLVSVPTDTEGFSICILNGVMTSLILSEEFLYCSLLRALTETGLQATVL